MPGWLHQWIWALTRSSDTSSHNPGLARSSNSLMQSAGYFFSLGILIDEACALSSAQGQGEIDSQDWAGSENNKQQTQVSDPCQSLIKLDTMMMRGWLVIVTALSRDDTMTRLHQPRFNLYSEHKVVFEEKFDKIFHFDQTTISHYFDSRLCSLPGCRHSSFHRLVSVQTTHLSTPHVPCTLLQTVRDSCECWILP